MATDIGYVEFVCEQLQGLNPQYKKMFGEYMIYLDGKPVFLVCDDTVFIKKHEALKDLMTEAECGIPYGGAKEHYILDVENRELTLKVAEILKEVTPLPKKRKK